MSLVRPIPRKPSTSPPPRDSRKRVRESEEPSCSLKKRLTSSPRASSLSLTPSSATSLSLLKRKSDSPEVLSRNSPISPRLRSALEVLSSYSPTQGSNRSNNKPKLQSHSTCKRTEIQGKDDRLGSSRKRCLRRSSSPSVKLPRSPINKIEKPSLQKSRVVLPTFSYPTSSPPITKRSIKVPQIKDVQVIFNNMPTKPAHPSSPFLTPPPISPCCLYPSQHCSATSFEKKFLIVPSSHLPSVSPSQSPLCPHQCWQGNLNQGCGCPLIPTTLNYSNSPPISIEPLRERLVNASLYSPHSSFHNPSTSLKLSSDSHQNSTCRNSVQPFGSTHHEIKHLNDEPLSPGKRCSIDNCSSNISSPILHNSTLSPAHVRMETEAQIMREYQKLMDLRAQELVFRDMQKQLEASLAQMNQTQILINQPSACNLQERQPPSSPSTPIVL